MSNPPRARAAGRCEPPNMGGGNRTCVLYKSGTILPAKPALSSPYNKYVFKIIVIGQLKW